MLWLELAVQIPSNCKISLQKFVNPLIFITFTNPDWVKNTRCDTTNYKRDKNLSGD